jgi:hypothetical protein
MTIKQHFMQHHQLLNEQQIFVSTNGKHQSTIYRLIDNHETVKYVSLLKSIRCGRFSETKYSGSKILCMSYSSDQNAEYLLNNEDANEWAVFIHIIQYRC